MQRFDQNLTNQYHKLVKAEHKLDHANKKAITQIEADVKVSGARVAPFSENPMVAVARSNRLLRLNIDSTNSSKEWTLKIWVGIVRRSQHDAQLILGPEDEALPLRQYFSKIRVEVFDETGLKEGDMPPPQSLVFEEEWNMRNEEARTGARGINITRLRNASILDARLVARVSVNLLAGSGSFQRLTLSSTLAQVLAKHKDQPFTYREVVRMIWWVIQASRAQEGTRRSEILRMRGALLNLFNLPPKVTDIALADVMKHLRPHLRLLEQPSQKIVHNISGGPTRQSAYDFLVSDDPDIFEPRRLRLAALKRSPPQLEQLDSKLEDIFESLREHVDACAALRELVYDGMGELRTAHEFAQALLDSQREIVSSDLDFAHFVAPNPLPGNDNIMAYTGDDGTRAAPTWDDRWVEWAVQAYVGRRSAA